MLLEYKSFMGRFFCLTILSVFCVFVDVSNPAYAEDNPACHLRNLSSLDVHTLADGRISAPVKFQDREFFFLIDTAGVVSTIDPGIVEKMRLRQAYPPATLIGVGGSVLNSIVTLEDFYIGNLHGKKTVFFVEPENWRGLDGTIAPEMLRNFDVDFDFAAGKLNLMSQKHCPGQIVYWTRDPYAVVPMSIDNTGHIRIPISVDGKAMKATLDTGAAMSIMSMSAAWRFLDVDEKSAGMVVRDTIVNGVRMKNYIYPFKNISFEGVTISNPYIEILPDNEMHDLGSDMILGISVLRQLHMYVSYQERNLYVTPALAH